ncbi:endonuclease [Saccharothrix obliqua]|uniref:endonuclease n=1 Tax=Saccharothrix obliqua TaxID=2861747 RepID=UPI0027E23D8E|nr:endonuclease [Saccharothrix obliqua]
MAAATAIATLSAPTAAIGAAPVTVAEAITRQGGGSTTVRGYVVGQPTATSTVVRAGFPSDHALALADSPTATSPSQMLYVQVTASFRAAWGLRTNPGLLGTRIDVTGPLSAYFAHPGLTSPTAFAPAGPTTTTPSSAPGGDYYRDAAGKSGAELKTTLNRIIRTNTRLSYDQVWNALKATDEDPANPANVVLLYSGRSQSKSANGGNADDWNREHVWAKSHGDFGTATGPGTDLHHLRPEDVSVNANRGNKDFDTGGSPAAEAPGNRTDGDSWEPRDAVKGDVARMLFYMAVRYEGGDGFPDLELNDSVSNGSKPYMGRLSVLLRWHAQDPPDSFEKRRNQVIFDTYQHNRNPFVDHPEWAGSIWG